MRKVTIDVDARIWVPLSSETQEVAERLRSACTHDNPAYSKNRAMGYRAYGIPPKITTWRHEDSGKYLTLPRGALDRARTAFRAANLEMKVRDGRTEGSVVGRPLRYRGPELRGYQRAMIAAAMAKQQTILRASTGSGKSITAMALAAEVGLNTLVILPTAGLLKQFAEQAEKVLGLRGDALGIVREDKRRLRPLTLASQKTLWSRGVDEELREYFGALIVDEAHHVSAKTYQEVVDAFPAKYRVAMSADEKRRDRMEFLVYDQFSAVGYEATREACEAAGAIVDVEIRVVPTRFSADWYRLDPDFNQLLDQMTDDADRNALVEGIVTGELEAGEQVIVLTHRREHARALEGMMTASGEVRTGLLLGGQGADEAEFERTRAGLLDGSSRVGFGTYGALGEGIDLPAVAVGVATTPIAMNKQKFNQVRGRLCRPSADKASGRLYVLFDTRVFDERVLRNIAAWNRTVNVLDRERWVPVREYIAAKRSRLAS